MYDYNYGCDKVLGLAFAVIELGSFSESKREDPQIIYPEIERPKIISFTKIDIK